jgi:hypothetical protein
MTTHTPGPWDDGIHHATTSSGRTVTHILAAGQAVPVAAVPLGVEGYGREEGEANARLIAAAPDMLHWLKRITGRMRDTIDHLSETEITELELAERCVKAAEGRGGRAIATPLKIMEWLTNQFLGRANADQKDHTEDDAKEVEAARNCVQEMLVALRAAEGFMAGFEGDELQDGIDERLALVRAAIAKAEGENPMRECLAGIHSWAYDVGKLSPDTRCKHCGEMYGNPEGDEQGEFVAVPDWNGPDYATLEQFAMMIAGLFTPEDIAARDNISMDEVEKRMNDEFFHDEYEALLSIVHKARKMTGTAATVATAASVEDRSETSAATSIKTARDALREALDRTDWLDPVHFRNAIADVVNDLDGFMKLASTADNAPAI